MLYFLRPFQPCLRNEGTPLLGKSTMCFMNAFELVEYCMGVKFVLIRSLWLSRHRAAPYPSKQPVWSFAYYLVQVVVDVRALGLYPNCRTSNYSDSPPLMPLGLDLMWDITVPHCWSTMQRAHQTRSAGCISSHHSKELIAKQIIEVPYLLNINNKTPALWTVEIESFCLKSHYPFIIYISIIHDTS